MSPAQVIGRLHLDQPTLADLWRSVLTEGLEAHL